MITSDDGGSIKYVKKEKPVESEKTSQNYMIKNANQSLIKYLNKEDIVTQKPEFKINNFANYLNEPTKENEKIIHKNKSKPRFEKEAFLNSLFEEDKKDYQAEKNQNNSGIVSQKENFMKSLLIEDLNNNELVATKNKQKLNLQKREMLKQLLSQDDNGEE